MCPIVIGLPLWICFGSSTQSQAHMLSIPVLRMHVQYPGNMQTRLSRLTLACSVALRWELLAAPLDFTWRLCVTGLT